MKKKFDNMCIEIFSFVGKDVILASVETNDDASSGAWHMFNNEDPY